MATAGDDPKDQLANIQGHISECCVQSQTSGGYDLYAVETCLSLSYMDNTNSKLVATFMPKRIAVFEKLADGIY